MKELNKYLLPSLLDSIKMDGDSLYDMIVPKHVRTALEVLPEEYFEFSDHFDVKNKTTGEWITIRMTRERHRLQTMSPFSFESDKRPDCATVVRLIREKNADYRQGNSRVSALLKPKIRHFIDTFKSANRLVFVWPEIRECLPTGITLSDRARAYEMTERQRTLFAEIKNGIRLLQEHGTL